MLLHLQVSQQRAHRTARAPHPAHATHTAHEPHSWCTCSLCRSICGRRAVRAAGALALRGWWSSSPFSFVIRCGKRRPMCTASGAPMPACDPIVQRGLYARMMASYHDQHLIPCVLIAIHTCVCVLLYEQVILINAASAAAMVLTHACGATSSGWRVVSGSVRSCLELPVALVPRPTHPGHMPRWLGIMEGCVVECKCC